MAGLCPLDPRITVDTCPRPQLVHGDETRQVYECPDCGSSYADGVRTVKSRAILDHVIDTNS